MPSPSDSTFWSHIPSWMWPILVAAVLGFILLTASKHVASAARTVGAYLHDRATAPRRTLDRVTRIEELLAQTSDRLECATSYLVIDADYHHHADILVAENAPKLLALLPKRIPYTEFSRMWQSGWRP